MWIHYWLISKVKNAVEYSSRTNSACHFYFRGERSDGTRLGSAPFEKCHVFDLGAAFAVNGG